MALAAAIAAVDARDVRADAPPEPPPFDYTERTGFPLRVENRTVPAEDVDALVSQAVRSGKPLDDWQTVRDWVGRNEIPGREKYRLVRVYTDKPVYIAGDQIVLPRADEPLTAPFPLPSVASYCNTAAGQPSNCISIHHDNTANREVRGIVLAARTIIVSGTNHTGGLSLVTMTENLIFDAATSAKLDLSARQDPAPTLGRGLPKPGSIVDAGADAGTDSGAVPNPYTVFPGDPSDPEDIPDFNAQATLDDPSKPPGPLNEWTFGIYGDLEWQMRRAREVVPDYDWGPDAQGRSTDPCSFKDHPASSENETDPESCYKRRDPRGLAGLPGGSWYAITYRASPIVADSHGQPGGTGSRGIEGHQWVACNPIEEYDSVYELPTGLFGGCKDNYETGYCDCLPETCRPRRCTFNYEKELPPGGQDCAVVCNAPPLSNGGRGGQAGPGGDPGIVRIEAVTQLSDCDSFFTASKLVDPNGADALDERCVDAMANDGGPSLGVDCASKFCKDDVNVNVCSASATAPVYTANLPGNIHIPPGLFPVPEPPGPGSLPPELINPIVQPVVSPTGAPVEQTTIVPLGDTLFAVYESASTATMINADGTIPPSELLEIPAWAPQTPVALPRFLYAPSAGTDSRPLAPTAAPLSADVAPRCDCRPDNLARCMSRCPTLSKDWVGFFRAALAGSRLARTATMLYANAVAGGAAPDVPVTLQGFLGVRFSGLGAKAHISGAGPVFVLKADKWSSIFRLGLGASGSMKTPSLICSADPPQFDLAPGADGDPGHGGEPVSLEPTKCTGFAPNHTTYCDRPAVACKAWGPCSADCVEDIEFAADCSSLPTTFTGYQTTPLYTQQVQPMGGPPILTAVMCEPKLTVVNGVLTTTCEETCSHRIPGGVDCMAEWGPEGVKVPASAHPTPPDSLVRALPRSWWATAVDVLHPLELRRRAGAGNSQFKQGNLLPAAAKYLSTAKHVEAVIGRVSPFAECPDDPTAATGWLGRRCTLRHELDQHLLRLVHGENFYGYRPNYVPPAGAHTFDPNAPVDLFNRVTTELVEHARPDMSFWLTYGGDVDKYGTDSAKMAADLDNNIEETSKQYSDPNGSLQLALGSAQTSITGLQATLYALQTQIHALNLDIQTIQVKLQDDPGKQFFTTAGDLIKAAAVAAATAYGGPAVGAAGIAAWDAAALSRCRAM